MSKEWISVKERLPEMHSEIAEVDGEKWTFMRSDFVLVFVPESPCEGCVFVGHTGVDKNGLVWVKDDGCDLSDMPELVTHWMPIPELPEV